MPVVAGLQAALLPVPIPSLAKVPIVLALSVLILVVSYDPLVRKTWIGVLLNSRRFDRQWVVVRKEPLVSAG